MRGRRPRLLIAAAVGLFVAACSDSEPEPDARPQAQQSPAPAPQTAEPRVVELFEGAPRVIESFNVGDQVYVRSLAVEPANDGLWVGTSVGVLEIDLATHEMRNTFTREHGLANEYVFAIHIDRAGHKWFGTNAGGVSRFRDGDWQVYFPMHGLADYWIYSFAEQPDGVLWIGTWAGANRVTPDNLEFTTYIDELINEWVYGIDIDSKNRVWFGTEGGVSMFDGETWRHWTHESGLGAANVKNQPHSTNTGLGTRSRHSLSVLSEGEETYNPNYVFAVQVDDQDHVWAGTWGGGVARFDGDRWTNYTTADGLAGNIVYSIAREPSGVFWFGTNHGLTRYDGSTWTVYDRDDGLLHNHVYAIAVAPSGEVWAGTKGGVARLGK